MTRMNWDSVARKRNLCKPSTHKLYRAMFAANSFSGSQNSEKSVSAIDRRPAFTPSQYLPPCRVGTDAIRHHAPIQALLEAAQDAARLHDHDHVRRYAQAARQSMIHARIDRSDPQWELASRLINDHRR